MNTSKTIPKAKPTTWNGVTFRSKSEAIFAVALEGFRNGVWCYEPKLHGFDFLPDFMVIWAHPKGFSAYIIEYKPSKPTDEYVEHLFECYEAFLRGPNPTAKLCTQCCVIYGSSFNRDTLQQISYDGDDQSLATEMQDLFEAAAYHRFDLEAQ